MTRRARQTLMASLARTGHEAERADRRLQLVVPAASGGSARLEAAHRAAPCSTPSPASTPSSSRPSERHRSRSPAPARRTRRIAWRRAIYVANVVVWLAAEGELDATDARIAVDTLAEARGEPRRGGDVRPLSHRLREPAPRRAAAARRVRDPAAAPRAARRRERGLALEGRGELHRADRLDRRTAPRADERARPPGRRSAAAA